MDPITLAVLAAAVFYATAAPDPVTLRVTRGAAGAIGSGAVAGVDSIRSDWAQGAPSRAKRRGARRAAWRKAGGWRRAALIGEWGAIHGWRGLRAVGRAAGRAVWRGAKAAPGGFTAGKDTAVARRRARRDVRADKRATRRAQIGRQWPDFGDGWERVDQEMADATVTASIDPSADSPKTPAQEGGSTTATGDTDMAGTDFPRLRGGGELTNIGQLKAEIGDVQGLVESLSDGLKQLRKHAGDLAERYAGSGFGTQQLSKAMGDYWSTLPPEEAYAQMTDALSVLDQAIRDAEAVGEVADTNQAHGDIEAFRAA